MYAPSRVDMSVVFALTLFYQPIAALGTNFLNHTSLLTGLEDPDWFEENIPFLDVPDAQIQAVYLYYYRYQTYKEHLVYTGAQYGYTASEFLHPVDYGAPYGGVVAAAGHHITEGRWLRNHRYGQGVANYWLAGPGTFSKPTTDNVNADTSDWAHEYSFWAASALWRHSLGLYWQVPVWDATEYTAASYESSDPYHGGAGYRPTINSYQYGDARAIAAIAALAGNRDISTEYTQRADALQKAVQHILWDTNAQNYKHRARDNNPSGALLTTREIMGYLPHSAAFAQLKDSQGFSARYGPTTAERRSKLYMHEATTYCRWDGPSWPFATSQTLTAVENLLNDYPAQTYFSAADYLGLLGGYAATQYKNGQPYVAEAHDPDADVWMYDSSDHSEDYNHSTFVDNIIAGLIGLHAQPDDTLVNSRWTSYASPNAQDYFALDLRRPQAVSDVRLYFYDDGGGVRRPASYDLHQTKITFPTIVTSQLRVVAPNPGAGNGWGLSEFEVWTSAVFQLRNENSGKLMGVAGMSTANSANIQQYEDNGTRDHLWEFVRAPGGWFKIRNLNSGLLLGVQGASTANSAVLQQYEDNGTSDHLWRIVSQGKGLFLLKNRNSGLFAGVDGISTANSANIVQFEDNGTKDYLWSILPAVPAS
ncbi:hypothetical protein NEUTE1DRAFT_140342 [Neurospora tetrasperma FGSC 2508]|uniref:Uncharacterized protein n=1 Tax=Neurospora tetrasperma (strain FGSC 2508 / ATCC MYA-4615 / P0657) TaxID=510951 RepID=F8MVU5_NEUT8|nr:uncharacterized protein NEUTE1DRAFT_140342 [Neurospora tetrasperma FGSC 2508]EGO53993.1 hypothetical protein NEUTE1DRAFT_140342 [Neurospora tetrasperma FGSC 2508]